MSDRDVTVAPDDYTAKLMTEVERLQAENAKMRELENIRILQVKHCEDLDAKNAKLLKELEAEHALAEQLGHYHEDAKAENAKLRKLVRGLDYCSDELNFAECDKCPLHDSDPNLEPKCVRMMRELGIEEDE